MKSSLPYSLVGIMEAIDSRWTHHSRYISTFAAPLVHPCSHSLRLVSRSSQTSNSRFGLVTTLALQLNFRPTLSPPRHIPAAEMSAACWLQLQLQPCTPSAHLPHVRHSRSCADRHTTNKAACPHGPINSLQPAYVIASVETANANSKNAKQRSGHTKAGYGVSLGRHLSSRLSVDWQ